MKPLTQQAVAFAVSSALALALGTGCGKSGGPAAPYVPPPSLTLMQALNAALPATVPIPAGLDTTASLMATLHLPIGLKSADAAFIQSNRLVDAGIVWTRTLKPASGALDSVQLTKTASALGGSAFLIYTSSLGAAPTDLNVHFDGVMYHVFDVGGSATVPAFIDSVQSVKDLSLTAPNEADVVTRANGLNVTWSDGGTDASVWVVATVIANSDTTLRASAAAVADPAGTLNIPGYAFVRMPAGAARVAVARFRLAYHMIGAIKVGLLCESATVRSLTLN